MFLIPYRRTAIHSVQPPGPIADRLRRVTAPRQPWLKSLHGRYHFVGSVDASRFRITPVAAGRNSYLPTLHGRMRPTEGGTEIQIVESIHSVVVVVLLGVFVGLPWMLAGFGRDFLIWLAVLFLLHCCMYFIGFLPAARRAKDRIRQIAGQPPVDRALANLEEEPRPSDHDDALT